MNISNLKKPGISSPRNAPEIIATANEIALFLKE